MPTDNANHSREDRTDRRMEGKRAFFCPNLRPCTPDGLPCIGPIPGLQNTTVATGHSMLGLSLAPVTGQLVTDLITNSKPELALELHKLAPERFG